MLAFSVVHKNKAAIGACIVSDHFMVWKWHLKNPLLRLDQKMRHCVVSVIFRHLRMTLFGRRLRNTPIHSTTFYYGKFQPSSNFKFCSFKLPTQYGKLKGRGNIKEFILL